MKKFAVALVAFAAVGLASVTAYAITEKQSIVIPILESLKLEPVKSKVIGGPQKFKVTKDTIKLLEDAMKSGKVITIDGDGKLTIEKDDTKPNGDK